MMYRSDKYDNKISVYHLIFFKGKLETMDYFTDKICEGADKLGIDYYIASYLDSDSYTRPEFFEFIKQENCVAVLLNQIGLNLQCNGQNLWEMYNIPVYNFVQDHPRNFDDALNNPIKNMHVICLDRNHIKFIKEYYPSIQYTHFMPNGGAVVEMMNDYENRPIDVLYVGDCQQEITQYPAITFLKNNGKNFFETVIAIMLQEHAFTTEDTIDLYFNAFDEKCTKEQLRMLNETAAGYIEATVRRYYKQKTMQALDKAGVNVEVYGKNWADKNYNYGSTIHFHERVSSDECNLLAGKSKIALNCMPWFKDGCSERVFNSMLNGAVCVSDTSIYLQERYVHGQDIVFYELNNIEQMVEDIKYLLENVKAAQHIATRGYQKAIENDTWVNRMQTIIGFINS